MPPLARGTPLLTGVIPALVAGQASVATPPSARPGARGAVFQGGAHPCQPRQPREPREPCCQPRARQARQAWQDRRGGAGTPRGPPGRTPGRSWCGRPRHSRGCRQSGTEAHASAIHKKYCRYATQTATLFTYKIKRGKRGVLRVTDCKQMGKEGRPTRNLLKGLWGTKYGT